jgi:hypothetical protein
MSDGSRIVSARSSQNFLAQVRLAALEGVPPRGCRLCALAPCCPAHTCCYNRLAKADTPSECRPETLCRGAHRLTVWAWREAAGIINGPLIRVVAKGGRRDEAPARHEQHHA